MGTSPFLLQVDQDFFHVAIELFEEVNVRALGVDDLLHSHLVLVESSPNLDTVPTMLTQGRPVLPRRVAPSCEFTRNDRVGAIVSKATRLAQAAVGAQDDCVRDQLLQSAPTASRRGACINMND